MPPPPEPKVSQAEKVRFFIKKGIYDSAIRIAVKWPKLGDAREAVTEAMEAVKHPSEVRKRGDDPGELVLAGVAALIAHLKMKV